MFIADVLNHYYRHLPPCVLAFSLFSLKYYFFLSILYLLYFLSNITLLPMLVSLLYRKNNQGLHIFWKLHDNYLMLCVMLICYRCILSILSPVRSGFSINFSFYTINCYCIMCMVRFNNQPKNQLTPGDFFGLWA